MIAKGLSWLGIHPWALLGVVLGVLGALGGAYVKGRLDCSANYQLATLHLENRSLREAIKLIQEDAEQARVDAKKQSALERDIEALEAHIASLPSRDIECLNASDTERVRSLWGR